VFLNIPSLVKKVNLSYLTVMLFGQEVLVEKKFGRSQNYRREKFHMTDVQMPNGFKTILMHFSKIAKSNFSTLCDDVKIPPTPFYF